MGKIQNLNFKNKSMCPCVPEKCLTKRVPMCVCVSVCVYTQSEAGWMTAPHYRGAQPPSSDGTTLCHVLWTAPRPSDQQTRFTQSLQRHTEKHIAKIINILSKVIIDYPTKSHSDDCYSRLLTCFVVTWWLVSMSSIKTPSL